MNMLMTFYTYPLTERIPISKTLNAYLDNPRTEDEIDAVRKYIERSYKMESAFAFPIYSDQKDAITLERLINDFCKRCSGDTPYINQFCKSYNRNNIYNFMARMWVVARYDDEGVHEDIRNQLDELKGKGQPTIPILLEDDNPIIANSKRLVEFSYLVSLFIHTEDENYYGSSFLLDEDPSQFSFGAETSRHIPISFFNLQGLGSGSGRVDSDYRWRLFPNVQSNIQSFCQRLDSAFTHGLTDKLSYVATLLKIVGHDITDEKTKLVMLVSIIELLLTHNPNFNRFNVEDSISKQFYLKTSLLVYLNDKSKDIYEIKNKLKYIYNLRSSIAHGNFKVTEKHFREHSGIEDEKNIDYLISTLYAYIKAILEEYLNNSSFIDFLKEN